MDLDLNLTPQEEDVQHPQEDEHHAQEEDVQQTHHRELPDSHRYAVYVALKALEKDRQVTRADKKHVAALLETSLTTIRRIWTAAREQQRAGKRIVEVDVSIKKKGNCGRKKSELGLSRIPSIELNKRSTLRGLARELNVPYATLQRRFQWVGVIHCHTSSIKPALKPENKILRLKFCTSMFDQATTSDDK
jgi:hypothetical protein